MPWRYAFSHGEGYLTLFDPPKESVLDAIAGLNRQGVDVKILTGDNQIITQKVRLCCVLLPFFPQPCQHFCEFAWLISYYIWENTRGLWHGT